jgi:hypothetical protein
MLGIAYACPLTRFSTNISGWNGWQRLRLSLRLSLRLHLLRFPASMI